MVTGTIEIDGAPRLVWGCQAVPMEMHRELGSPGFGCVLAARPPGPPRGLAHLPAARSGEKAPQEAGPRRLRTLSL